MTIKPAPAMGGAALSTGKGTAVVSPGWSSKLWDHLALTSKSDFHTNADFGITSFP